MDKLGTLKLITKATIWLRDYIPEDYFTIASWWAARGLPVAPHNYLTSNGVIVQTVDKAIAAGFLYRLDVTPMYSLDSIVSNPEATSEERTEAVKLLIKFAKTRCKELGGQLLLGFSHTDGLTQKLEESGFKDSGRTYKHLGIEV